MTDQTEQKATYYKLQFVSQTKGFVPPLYLVRASSPAKLDAVARGLMNEDVVADDYISKRVTGVPERVQLKDGETLKLGVELAWGDTDLNKIDWTV